MPPPAKTSWASLLLVLSSIANPATAQVGYPRIEQARQARLAGQSEEAIRLLEQADRDRPDNPETLRLLGTAYASASRYREAITTLQRARVIAPRDRDIALALSRALLWSGDAVAAKAVADEIAVAEPDNVELPQLNEAIARTFAAPAGRGVGLALGHGISWISIRGQDRTWRNTLLAIDAPVSRSSTLSVEAEHEDRAGIGDTRLAARIDRRFGIGTSGYAAITATPDADFRESWSARVGGESLISRNVALSVDVRHASFRATNVTILQPGIRLQSADGTISFTVQSLNLWAERDQHQSGWSVRGAAPLPARAVLTLGASTYPDTEAGITRRVRGAFASIAVPLSDRLTLRAVADHETRRETYSRTGVALSLGWRFGR